MPGFMEIVNRFLRLVRLGIMLTQQRNKFVQLVGIEALQGFSHRPVQRLTVGLQQRLISRLTYQGVPKEVFQFGMSLGKPDETGRFEAG